jgi:N-acetylglucosaminyldiphosphoundecaprenol N-acetyl-beta-D-mannosaminyltransferase
LLGVGVTFSFVAGTVRRAPLVLRKLALEWAWRLLCEPRRLWRRYLDNLVHFPALVLKTRFKPKRA